MFKTGLVLGFAAGYVLGTRAGKERYQQIVDAARGLTENPGVQRFTDEVNKTVSVGRERASNAASRTVEQAGTQLAEKTHKASDKVSGGQSTQDNTA